MKLNNESRKIIYEFLCKVEESLSGFRNPNPEPFSFTEADREEDRVASYNVNDVASRDEKQNDSCASGRTAASLLVSKAKTQVPPSSLTASDAQVSRNAKALPVPPVGTVEPLTDKALWELSQVSYDVSHCSLCKLCETRTKTVFGEGCFSDDNREVTNHRPLVMIIGEGPGHDEDVTGRPFVGRAGQLLDKMLLAIGLSREVNCYICNVVKCRPPNNREPSPDEIKFCIAYLHKQIEILKPSYILLMGRTACHALLDTSEGINRLHGKFFTVDGITAMCTYHPSALLHNEVLKRPAWEDLKLFRNTLLKENQI